jgi:hypothetical protein
MHVYTTTSTYQAEECLILANHVHFGTLDPYRRMKVSPNGANLKIVRMAWAARELVPPGKDPRVQSRAWPDPLTTLVLSLDRAILISSTSLQLNHHASPPDEQVEAH